MEERLTLKQMIMNTIDNHPWGYAKTLAQVAGYGENSGNLTRILKDEKKEFDKFQGLKNLVSFIWEKESVEMMVKYSEEIDPNKKTARHMLEYLQATRQSEAFYSLLNKMDESSNKESKEWAKIYRIAKEYETTRTEIEYNTIIQKLYSLKVNTVELSVFKKLLLNYCYSQKHDYNMTKSLASEIELELDSIESDYIKEMYRLRLNEVRAYNYLRANNDPVAARKYSDEILESSEASSGQKAYAYFIKGYSYLFTSCEKAVRYLTFSMNMYAQMGKTASAEDLAEKIEFAKIYWGKQTSDDCVYKNNYLFLYIKKGYNLDTQLKQEKENINEAFYLLLEGLNEKSNKKLVLSLLKYVKKNDAFLANLARIELVKTGYDEEILEEMVNMSA